MYRTLKQHIIGGFVDAFLVGINLTFAFCSIVLSAKIIATIIFLISAVIFFVSFYRHYKVIMEMIK